jgi:hypothetical protein
MSIANPPTEDLPIFDTSVFTSDTTSLTTADADLRYLRYPVSQGSETISANLVVSGITTLAPTTISGSATINGATFNQSSPAFELNYPVNSGRFDFYANTAGGVNTRGGKIDATGVHTISKFDTIDEVGGLLDIGTATTRTGTISIGSSNPTANKSITIGNQIGTGTCNTSLYGTSVSVGSGNTTATAIQCATTGGAINIGTAGSTSTITIGNNTAGTSTIANLRSNTINIQGSNNTGSLLIGSTMTSGTLTIGGSSTNTLTIQRPIQLSSGSDPASASSAIGYQLPSVSSGTGVLSLPLANLQYTISTGLRTLGIGVWLLSLNVDFAAAASVANFNYNMGFMSSAPITGDSATASSAPTNTIAGINGNVRSDDNTNLTNGTYIYQIGGVVVNNYGGTYNNMYGIMNFTWNTTGTIDIGAFRIIATRIG